MSCKNCGQGVTSDGYGELVHENEDGSPGTYGCNPRAARGGSYPVASV
jgi:hypothetical protein